MADADADAVSPAEKLPYSEPDSSNTLSPLCHGPTSSAFTLDILKDSFKAKGFDPATMTDAPPLYSYKEQLFTGLQTPGLSPILRGLLADPLWTLGENEAVRLIHLFSDGPGAMHPVLERASLIADCKATFGAMTDLKQGRKTPGAAELLMLFDLTTLKLALCIATVLEKKDTHALATQMFDSVKNELTGSFWHAPSLQSAINFLLAALYYFHLDQEPMAGRFICMAARVCFELGLNRREITTIDWSSDANSRTHATVVFRSVYMLDRRLSVGVGVPAALNDSEVEQVVSQPLSEEVREQHQGEDVPSDLQARRASRQYVIVMTNYIQLAGKAGRIVNNLSERHRNFPKEEFEYLDFQVIQWQQDLPDSLKSSRAQLTQMSADDRKDHVPLFLRVVLNTKAYQLRNLLHRPVLHFPSRITNNMRYARTAVEIARESILYMSAVSETTNFLRMHPVLFKHFLISALSILLLAMANAWDELGRHVSEEFWQALDLFKVISVESPLVMRYWKTISALETLARKVGLPERQAPATLGNSQVSNSLPTATTQAPAYTSAVPSDLGQEMDFDVELGAMDIRSEFLNFFQAGTGFPSDMFDLAATPIP